MKQSFKTKPVLFFCILLFFLNASAQDAQKLLSLHDIEFIAENIDNETLETVRNCCKNKCFANLCVKNILTACKLRVKNGATIAGGLTTG